MADTLETIEVEVKYRAGGAATALKSVTNAVKGLSKSAKSAKNPLENFVSSLKRIAFYRFIRSIIKGITSAFTEGLQKAYIFSSGIEGEGHRFAEALDRMKSAGNQMKGQLGSAFAGLLAAIEPILITIINLITKVADAISQFFAAFTGKTYLKANATAAKFADTMKSGAGAAKEWKNQLMGFDEINRLNEPSNGGGGGGSNPLAGYDFADTPISKFWLDLVSKIKEFYNLLKDKLQPAIDRLKEAFGRLKEAWMAFVDSFDGSKLQQLITDLLTLGGETIINGLTIVADTLTLVLDVLTALNTGDWSKVWRDLKQLIYDVAVAIGDLLHGITLLIMDGLIIVAGIIDNLLGTDLAGWLQKDRDAFDEMYRSSRDSEDGLLGLKKALGLTEGSTKDAAKEAQTFSTDLEKVGTQADETEDKIWGVRDACAWVGQGFRDFGMEIYYAFQPAIDVLRSVCEWLNSVLEGLHLTNIMGGGIGGLPTGGGLGGGIGQRAEGGFVPDGQLFLAREAGPELVGSIGGRTAVANNDQIVEGIRQGVYDAVMAANSNGNGDVSVRVYLDSREIKAGQQRLARAMG